MNPCFRNKCISPSDPIYKYARLNYNLDINDYPDLIIYCSNATSVINALKFVKDNKIPFRIRSGRHDFEAISNLNNGIVIDITKIDFVKINSKDNTAKVGGGILMGDLYSTLAKSGYTIPGGTCADVGASGLTTCAGIGFATRYLSLTLDNLLEVELIDANLNKLVVNKCHHCDLFWALKGGLASNFGIITSLTYKISPVSKVSVFKLKWKGIYAKELMNFWQDFGPFTDKRLTTNFVYQKNSDGLSVNCNGQFFGNVYSLITLITPLLNIAPYTSFYIENLTYDKAISLWEEDCYPPNTFKNSGSFIYDHLSSSTLDKLVSFVNNSPSGFLHYLEFLPLGGNVLKVPEISSAFPNRSAKFLIQIKSIWEYPSERSASINWTNTVKDFLDLIGIGTYRGFTDFNIEDWQSQYYGENYYALQKIKAKYDPNNFFRFCQSIKPLYNK